MTNLPALNFYSKQEIEWLVSELINLNIIMFGKRQLMNPNTVKMLNKKNRFDIFSLVYKYTDFIEDLQNKKFIDRVRIIYRERHVSIDDVETCAKPSCVNQVLMLCGPYRVKGQYCCDSCSLSHRNYLSSVTINPKTGLTYSKESSMKMRDTLENTFDEEGLTLEQKRHKATSEGRLELTEEGISNAAFYRRIESERRKNTIDPETGMDLNQLYGQRSKEAKYVVGDDGLTTFQRLGQHLSEFYKTPQGEKLKEQQSQKQRETLLGKNNLKNLFDDDEKKRYRIYKRRVRYYTSKNNLTNLENYEKWGEKHKDYNAYQLDHIYSIMGGFEEDIPPYIIGSVENLQFIHWRDNATKGPKCWITKEELFERVLKTDYDPL